MKKYFCFSALALLFLCLSCGGGGSSSGGGGSSANNVNGSWSGTWQSNSGAFGAITCTINQSGSTFTGTAVITNSPCFSGGTISGSVSDNNISFSAPYGNFSGTLTGASISGTYNVTSGFCKGDTGTFKLQR